MEKKDFRKLYEDLVKSDWFKKVYHDKSLGECPFEIPELMESEDERIEDERIRKELIDMINECTNWAHKKKYITYLERQKPSFKQISDSVIWDSGLRTGIELGKQQKEQKPEPVFKIGDKIKLKSEPTYPYREIVDIKNGAYYFDEAVHLPFDNQNNWEKEQKSINLHDKIEELCSKYPINKYSMSDKELSAYHQGIHLGATKLAEYLSEQKSWEWREEDESTLKEIISFFKDGTVKLQHDLDLYAGFLEKRLKFLRPQPKQEWSKEDERKYQCIRNILLTDMDKKVGSWKYSEILEWYEKRGIGRYTNSQSSWKPSEEQIRTLDIVISDYRHACIKDSDKKTEILKQLLEQIKKL